MSADPTVSDPLVGTVVAGRYHVERRVAAGGMGVVYEARQEPLGRRVALKVIRGDVTDPVTRLRFEREARAASALQDAHVVVVHDFGVIDGGSAHGGLFLAMEFVDGQTLRAHLSAAGRLPWDATRRIVRQIAQALAAAHARALVHRDLKPENVIVVDGGGAPVCKVLDFGLAKGTGHDTLLRASSDPLTHSGGFVGTPGYISPEIIDGADDDPRQDVYALGVVWWELLTGRHPFPAETPMKTLVRQMHEEAPVVDDILRATDNIPVEGVQLLREMMARNPLHRPKDGAAVLARLDALQHDTLVDRSTPPTSLSSSSSTPLSPWPDRQEQPTIDGRLHRQTIVETQPSLSLPPRSSSGSSGSSSGVPPPSAANVTVVAGRRRRRRWALAVVGAGIVGGISTQLFETAVENVKRPVVDAGVLDVVDAGVAVVDAGVLSTELVVNGVSTFGALRQLRALLPTHTLRIYRPGQSELEFAGDVASVVADTLQDLQFEHDGAHFAVDVGDVDSGRVTVTVSAAPADLVLQDAGVDVAPGGLEP